MEGFFRDTSVIHLLGNKMRGPLQLQDTLVFNTIDDATVIETITIILLLSVTMSTVDIVTVVSNAAISMKHA